MHRASTQDSSPRPPRPSRQRRLILVAAALLLAAPCCKKKEPAPEKVDLPPGQLLVFGGSGDAGPQFLWAKDTSKSIEVAPLKVKPAFEWNDGATMGSTSLAYVPARGRFLFSGILPFGDSVLGEFGIWWISTATQTMERARLANAEDNLPRRVQPFGDEVIFPGEYGTVRTLYAQRENEPPRPLLDYDGETHSNFTAHPGGALFLHDVYGHGVDIYDGAGKKLATLKRPDASCACFAPSGNRFALFSSRGAEIYEFRDGAPHIEYTLPRETVDDDQKCRGDKAPDFCFERWFECDFSPRGDWVLFLSNRDLGNSYNPLAGVYNPKVALHAWNPATRREARVSGQVRWLAMAWAPIAE